MEKPRLNEEQYIAELNRRLYEHSDYEPGMEFLPYPDGARGGNISGVATAGVRYRHAYIDVEIAVQNEFDFEPTYAGFQRNINM